MEVSRSVVLLESFWAPKGDVETKVGIVLSLMVEKFLEKAGMGSIWMTKYKKRWMKRFTFFGVLKEGKDSLLEISLPWYILRL